MKRYAAIDVGSNSVLLRIVEKKIDGNCIEILDESRVTRLGRGLRQSGVLSTDSMQATAVALQEYAELLKSFDVTEVAIVGTMALRTAKNAAQFVEKIKRETGLMLEVIPGEEEARLSFLAAHKALTPNQPLVVFDVGGGSTEFIFGNGAEVKQRFSLDVGAIRLTENFLKSDPVKPTELDSCGAALEQEFARLSFEPQLTRVIGIGGTLVNMAAVTAEIAVFDPNQLNNKPLRLEQVEKLVSLFSSKTIAQRKKIIGLDPRRADIILAGSVIVLTIMQKLAIPEIIISTRGIRHGLLADRFGL